MAIANNINNTPTTINKIFRIFVKPKLASGKEDKAFRGEAVLDVPLVVVLFCKFILISLAQTNKHDESNINTSNKTIYIFLNMTTSKYWTYTINNTQ